MQYIQKVSLRKKYEFLLLTSRYWSLKREARRGAPLLKRLHLEPWTASNGSNRLQTEEERTMKLEVCGLDFGTIWRVLTWNKIAIAQTSSGFAGREESHRAYEKERE